MRKDDSLMIMKKYAISILLLLLCVLYSIWIDIRVGLPWNTVFVNWQLSFFTGAERWTAWALLLLLVAPDLYRGYKQSRNPSSDSAAPSGTANSASSRASSASAPSSSFVSGSGTSFSSSTPSAGSTSPSSSGSSSGTGS
ncbi:hypothetical protein D3C77_337470 [compost metagenome]